MLDEHFLRCRARAVERDVEAASRRERGRIPSHALILDHVPQLIVAAEWRDPAQLLRDHIDNAVIDVMLEGASRGDAIRYAWYRLPLYRLAKAYSVVLNAFGTVGPIPEGMSAAAALRNTAFSERQRALAAATAQRAAEHTRREGYPPPYWRLVALAREAARADSAR